MVSRSIDRRVEEMFSSGLVDEVRGLLNEARPMSKTARQAIGYREVLEYVEGARDLAGTIALVQQHTRQLAKRQCTWFRSLSECRFVPMADRRDPTVVAESIFAEILGEAGV